MWKIWPLNFTNVKAAQLFQDLREKRFLFVPAKMLSTLTTVGLKLDANAS